MSDISLEKFTEEIRAKVGADSGLKATIKFVFAENQVLYIDGESTPNTVDNTDREADCTVAISMANLGELLNGELEPVTGFMTGRFKVSGDMSVAMKLQRLV